MKNKILIHRILIFLLLVLLIGAVLVSISLCKQVKRNMAIAINEQPEVNAINIKHQASPSETSKCSNSTQTFQAEFLRIDSLRTLDAARKYYMLKKEIQGLQNIYHTGFDSLSCQISSYLKVDLQRDTIVKPMILFDNSTVEVGEEKTFTIIGKPGNIISFDSPASLTIKEVSQIDPYGNIKVTNKESRNEFIMQSPVQTFSYSSKELGSASIIVNVQDREGIKVKSNIFTKYIPKSINIRVDTFYIEPQTGKNEIDIVYELVFSSPVLEILPLNVTTDFIVNNQTHHQSSSLLIPEGAEKYIKRISYKYGRIPYHFEIKKVHIEFAGSDIGTEKVLYNLIE